MAHFKIFFLALIGFVWIADSERLYGSDEVLNVLIYGDAGSGDQGQYKVARGIEKVHALAPFSFAVSMGDNIYGKYKPGILKAVFEDPYKKLIADGVKFFQTIGNHDMEPGKLGAQLAYSEEIDAVARNTGGWVLPAEDYVMEANHTRWVILNVSLANGGLNWNSERAEFFERAVCQPFDGWTFLVVHYPLWSTNAHGDNKNLQNKLLPVLTDCPVDMILTGHDHHAEYIHPWNWTPHFVIGNGHESRSFVRPSARESLFSYRDLGFASMIVDRQRLQFNIFDVNGDVIYQTNFQKNARVFVDVWKQVGSRVLGRVEWRGLSAEDLEFEFGVASARYNPIFEPQRFAFFPAILDTAEADYRGFVFQSSLHESLTNAYVVSRVRRRHVPNDPWIYGDLSNGPGRHGSYDGLQTSMLLKLIPSWQKDVNQVP